MRCVLALLIMLTSAKAKTFFAWNADPDTTITGYNLYIGTTSGGETFAVNANLSTTCSYELSPGKYYAVVRAYNASGAVSPPSNEVAWTVVSSPVNLHIQ